jgi:hypothetical protein
MTIVLNVVVSALVIGFAVWLSRRFPAAAGFVVALPLATLLVLPLAQFQHGDAGNVMLLAKSIFVAIPVTLCFFVPFLLADRLDLSFWQSYWIGCFLLPIGFLIHRGITRLLWVGG